MGTSTNGQICYGVAFDEGCEFPWDADYDGDIDAWWIYEVHGFKHLVEIFDTAGCYLNGREPSPDEVSRYFKEIRDFSEDHPLPVKLVNYCSADCPMYALAAPSSVMEALRGYPTEFDPASLVVTDTERATLLRFFSDHGIEAPSDPKWLLTSYWG